MSKRLLPAKDIRTMFGDVSDMTLWRWLQDESLSFPRPIVIRNRRYWDADEIEAFRQRTINTTLGKRVAQPPLIQIQPTTNAPNGSREQRPVAERKEDT